MLIVLLASISALGLLGMTLLPGLAARLLAGRVSTASTAPRLGRAVPRSIAIVVPVHNEEHSLATTLESIQQAASQFRARFPEIAVRVIVGLDGCVDRSLQISVDQRIEILELAPNRGKWRTFSQLFAATVGSDWVISADAGVIWAPDLLLRIFPRMINPRVLAVAPGYLPHRASMIERLSWQMETALKRFENQSGGPISVHGATVAYRRNALGETLAKLAPQSWLNDDVVVPLLLRALHPAGIIDYLPEFAVQDSASETKSIDSLARRRRIVAGNLQWISGLLPEVLRRNAVVGLLTFRRVFRLLWAYWLATTVAATVLILQTVEQTRLVGPLFALLILALVAAALYRLRFAFAASLLAPFDAWRLSSAVAGGRWR